MNSTDTTPQKKRESFFTKNESAEETSQTPQLLLFQSTEEQDRLSDLEEIGFDEMNLVEIPFCTLDKRPSTKTTLPLSPGGHEYLQNNDQGYGLPTALAEPTVLGLLWLAMERNQFCDRKVVFTLRELVEDFMFPGQFNQYRAGGRCLAAVEQELHRIAATRIHSDRWYDRRLGERISIDASLIDLIKVLKKGGRHTPRVLEVVWGTWLYESVRARYTKGLDVSTWIQIRHGLDRRLFRWLDRQLHGDKRVEQVRSCQTWAKYKMLLQSYKLAKGGRTASNYVLSEVKEAITRLNGIGFAVRLTVDRSKPDFAFRFEKIASETNEVFDQDVTGDVVFEFSKAFHGATAKAKRMRESDRLFAKKWIEAYGFDQAVWMVWRCKELHEQGKRSGDKVLWMVGLEAYESCAAEDYARAQLEAAGQQRISFAEAREEQWTRYFELLTDRERKALEEAQELETFMKDVEKEAQAAAGQALANDIPAAKKLLMQIMAKESLFERANGLPKDAFTNNCQTEDELLAAVIERHGYNPLAAEDR